MRVLIKDISTHLKQTVCIKGYVQAIRRQSKIAFVVVADLSGSMQVVVSPHFVVDLKVGSSCSITGLIVAASQAPGGFEMQAEHVDIISIPQSDPLLESQKSLEHQSSIALPHLLDHAPQTWRHPERQMILKIMAASMQGFRHALSAEGFTEMQSPKIMGQSSESGAAVFSLDYFGKPAYLAQSPQFYKQMMVGIVERVFEIGPVFRAEPSETSRHLTQYTSMDAELGFIESMDCVMHIVETALTGMLQAVSEIESLSIELPVAKDIPRIHFTEALRIAGSDADDLSPSDERLLGEWAMAEYGSDFLFVTGYPMSKRPFYTMPSVDSRYSESFDLLFRGQELITGGQRLHEYDELIKALEGEDVSQYASYLEAFQAGMPPHGGFAIGLERFVQKLIGAKNIRETTLLPRDRYRLMP